MEDSERQTRRVRTFQIELDDSAQAPKLVWSRNAQDRYKDPGTPMLKALATGGRDILQDGDNIFLGGLGASPKGDHPFLDRYNLATVKSERLFQCDDDHYEVVDALLDEHCARFLTRRESPTEPPNYYVRTADGKMTAMTSFPDPQPIFRKVTRQLAWHAQRGLPDAEAWRQKFAKLHEQELLRVESPPPIVRVEEDLADTSTEAPRVFELKPLVATKVPGTQPQKGESVGDPYTISQTARAKMERANVVHRGTLQVLSRKTSSSTLMRFWIAVQQFSRSRALLNPTSAIRFAMQ